MSAKYFCDRCEFQMKKGEHERLCLNFEGVMVEVISGWKGTWNGGNICHRCIKAAVKHGKPAPR